MSFTPIKHRVISISWEAARCFCQWRLIFNRFTSCFACFLLLGVELLETVLGAFLGHKFKKLDQLFINFIDCCQPHIFKTADDETFCQILPVALESKKDNGWWFCFLKNNPKFKLFWVPSGSPTVQILMFRIQHIHRFSLIQLVVVCVHSPVGAVNEASSPPTPDQQSEGSWRVWTRSKPLAWSVFCHEPSSVLNRSKALGHTWRLSDRYCCSSHLWFQTAGVQLWSEQTSCEESLLDSLIQTRSSSDGLGNFSFRRPLLNPGD